MPPPAAFEARARDIRVQELPHHRKQVVERNQHRLCRGQPPPPLADARKWRLKPVRRVASIMHRVAMLPLVDRLLGRAEPRRKG
jgi:hypothetical protein